VFKGEVICQKVELPGMVWNSSEGVGGGNETWFESIWVDSSNETTATATTSRALEVEKEGFWLDEAPCPLLLVIGHFVCTGQNWKPGKVAFKQNLLVWDTTQN